ncbi:transposase [Melittangium boletus]|uniref:transposase n=1 Tax=Melittangium boletus TaxID=83453 RepID=UPI003DA677BE
MSGANKKSDLFIELLHALVQAHPRATRLHVILDNASMHCGQKARRALEALGGRVLPPYCPSANKIEQA